MKPENIKKVWEHYRGFQIRYRIGRSQYIIDAFNKNMNGDFSPSLFINPIESKVHLIVKEYIKCLLEQEALEQAQQEQTTIDTQQKAPTETEPQEQSTPTIEKAPKKQTQQPQAHKGHNSPPATKWIGGVRQSREVVKNMSFLSFCQKKSASFSAFCVRTTLNSQFSTFNYLAPFRVRTKFPVFILSKKYHAYEDMNRMTKCAE